MIDVLSKDALKALSLSVGEPKESQEPTDRYDFEETIDLESSIDNETKNEKIDGSIERYRNPSVYSLLVSSMVLPFGRFLCPSTIKRQRKRRVDGQKRRVAQEGFNQFIHQCLCLQSSQEEKGTE